MKRQVVNIIVVTALLSGSYLRAEALGPFRPPAVPLVTVDPYMSVWSFTDNLYDSWPVHWTGAVHAMTGMIRVDGRCYRFMGPESKWGKAVKQAALEVTPTRTKYTFQVDSVELKLIFTTPLLPDDLALMSSPITFVTFEARSLNKYPHDVQIYFDATAEWVVNNINQKVVWHRKPGQTGGMELLGIGSEQQPILEKSGDNIRIDWGHLYVGVPAIQGNSTVFSYADEARQSFSISGRIPKKDDTKMPRPANQDWIVAACVMDIGIVKSAVVEQHLMLAYDDEYSIEYMHKKLRPWWYKHFGGLNAMISTSAEDYHKILKRCDTFDKELMDDARRLGGEEYARIISLAYRQVPASGKIVVSPDGSEPWFFHKECFSNGCIATVDVSYPASPFFALFSPVLLNAMTAPVFEYAASGDWPHPFSPHDVGTYPKANGQVYNTTRLEGQMPVEECGNMILMTAAAAKASGDTRFARKHFKLLTQWAQYLKDKGLDPGNQLCTDDFTGHLSHNANLSLKAINALGAYAMLCEMMGEKTKAREYKEVAEKMAGQWPTMADDGDHYRLAFDKPGTWSMKYNLVWDGILELNLFDSKIARKEVAWYLTKQNPFGLPLDNRADFTKSDWLVWSATLAEKPRDFHALVKPLYRFINESPSRVPFSDWYFTSTGKVRGFRARTVIGGVFIKFLDDSKLWHKWASKASQ